MTAQSRTCLAIVLGLFLTLVGASPLTQPPDDATSPREALTTALRELTDEAREAKRTFVLSRTNADYAASFAHSIADDVIISRLLRPIDRDPFVDAYVRWQLTGFLDDLPELDDREFEKFLEELPECVPNPQMDPRFVQPLMKASEAGELSPIDQQRATKLLGDLQQHRDRAAALRRPAEALREWIAEHAGEEGHRPLQAALERCAALAKAGWNVDECKADITKRCEDALRDRSLDDERRQLIARQMANLTHSSALLVTGGYLADGSLVVSTDAVGVYDHEVRKWQKLLLDR